MVHRPPSGATRAWSKPTWAGLCPLTGRAARLEGPRGPRLDVLYGDYQVLWDVSFSAPARGRGHSGTNGSGKSTLMNTLSGLVRARSGEIRLGEQRIDGLPRIGSCEWVAHVLERRRLFPTSPCARICCSAPTPRREGAPRRGLWPTSRPSSRVCGRGTRRWGDTLGRRAADGRIGRGLMAPPPPRSMVGRTFLGWRARDRADRRGPDRDQPGARITVVFIEQNVELGAQNGPPAYILGRPRHFSRALGELLASTR